jgi:hypothetical protein
MVELYDELGNWEPLGSVLLPPRATRRKVEHALRAVGVYAPRGADQLRWRRDRATIKDSENRPLVRLTPRAASARGSVRQQQQENDHG